MKRGMRWHWVSTWMMQGDLDALVLLELDDAVEELFPMAVARHVVVGDEERRDALLVVLADDRFEIVGVAEAALAALHVDDGAERALERAAAAEVEARLLALVARQRGRRQMRRRRVLDARQVVHVVVERASACRSRRRAAPRRAGLPRPRRHRSRCPCPWLPGSRAARPAASTGSRRHGSRPSPPAGRPRGTCGRDRRHAGTGWTARRPGRSGPCRRVRLKSADDPVGADPRCWSRRTA